MTNSPRKRLYRLLLDSLSAAVAGLLVSQVLRFLAGGPNTEYYHYQILQTRLCLLLRLTTDFLPFARIDQFLPLRSFGRYVPLLRIFLVVVQFDTVFVKYHLFRIHSGTLRWSRHNMV